MHALQQSREDIAQHHGIDYGAAETFEDADPPKHKSKITSPSLKSSYKLLKRSKMVVEALGDPLPSLYGLLPGSTEGLALRIFADAT